MNEERKGFSYDPEEEEIDLLVLSKAEDITEVSQARNDVLQLEQAGAAVVGAIYKDAR